MTTAEAKSDRTADSVSGFERRNDERRDCCLGGVLYVSGRSLPCSLKDVGQGGVGFTLNSANRLQVGEKIGVETASFGRIDGVIRWTAHPRYGMEFEIKARIPKAYVGYFDSLNPERILRDRLDFLQFDERSEQAIRSLQAPLERHLPGVLDTLYALIADTPGIRDFFPDAGKSGKAKDAQLNHWDTITSGNLGGRYFNTARRIGFAHARIGLEPRWYIAGYAHVLSRLVEALVRERWPKSVFSRSAKDGEDLAVALNALVRATFLDMDLAISTYLHATEEARLKGEAEATDKERTVVTSSVGVGLSKLAEKDLTHRLSDDLPDVYRGLGHDFNQAMDQMAAALSEVSATTETVKSGMREIATASGDLAHRTEQQAANLEQTVAAIGEITDTVKSNAETARQVRSSIEAARADAERSGKIVDRTVDTMSQIANSSKEINQIIGVVDELAFQTNLLALNAGVEAARAGEVGRGFAVVATEVRALAHRSGEAAKQIRALITKSSGHVDVGVDLVAAAGAALQRISQQVTDISGEISQIADNAETQANGLREITTAMDEMDVLTQQNAAMAEQATAAAAALERETQRLARLAAGFRHADSRPPARPAAARSAA